MASSSSSTIPKNSRPIQMSSSSSENEPPQKIAKHSSNDNIGDDYVSSFTIDCIPDDILADILKMLPMSSWPKLQRINRQFNRSILLCWRGIHEIEFNKANFQVPVMKRKSGKMNETEARMTLESILKMLASYSPHTTSIIGFDYFVNYLPESTLMEISAFSYLKSVNFSNCEIKPDDLAVFLTGVATHLTELNISRCFVFDDIVRSAAEYVELRQNNDSKLFDAVRLLKLTKFYFDNNCALYGLFLEHLDASSITTISVVQSFLNADIFSSFLTRCHALTYLDISCPRFTSKLGEEEISFGHSIAPSILASLSSSTYIINNLSTLKMNDVRLLKTTGMEIRQQCERGFTDLFTKLMNLRELSLIKNQYAFRNIITETTIYSDRFRHLKTLHLGNIFLGEVNFVKLIKRMENLEQLIIICSGPYLIADQIIRALTTSPHLKESLRYLKFDRVFVTHTDILKILSMLQNLTGLSLKCPKKANGWVRTVNDDVLLYWSAAFEGRLKILELGNGSEISDAGFAVAATRCPNLIRLDLRDTEVSDVSLRSLSISCPKLKHLNLAYCKNITTAGVQNIIDSCHRLELLVLERSAVKYESLKVDQELSTRWVWDDHFVTFRDYFSI